MRRLRILAVSMAAIGSLLVVGSADADPYGVFHRSNPAEFGRPAAHLLARAGVLRRGRLDLGRLQRRSKGEPSRRQPGTRQGNGVRRPARES